MQRGRQSGFTLIELLVVVGIIGVLSAIAIWNYMIAINRAKQKSTMSDMRSIASSWEHYAQDHNSYVPAGAVFVFPDTPVTPQDLEDALTPQYMKNFQSTDGWDNDLDFATGSGSNYAIRSRGADGIIDDSYDSTKTKSFNNDIVFSDGVFVISPED